MSYSRKLALATGIFFVITIIASIPAAFVFYAPVLDDPRYIVGAGADTLVFWGRSSRFLRPSPVSALPSRCFRSSSGRTKQSPLATSPFASLKPPSSPSASSASFRS